MANVGVSSGALFYLFFMHINELGREAHEINEGNGWETFNTHSWPDGHTDRAALRSIGVPLKKVKK